MLINLKSTVNVNKRIYCSDAIFYLQMMVWGRPCRIENTFLTFICRVSVRGMSSQRSEISLQASIECSKSLCFTDRVEIRLHLCCLRNSTRSGCAVISSEVSSPVVSPITYSSSFKATSFNPPTAAWDWDRSDREREREREQKSVNVRM